MIETQILTTAGALNAQMNQNNQSNINIALIGGGISSQQIQNNINTTQALIPALNDPNLWENIDLQFENDFMENSDIVVEFMKLFFVYIHNNLLHIRNSFDLNAAITAAMSSNTDGNNSFTVINNNSNNNNNNNNNTQ